VKALDPVPTAAADDYGFDARIPIVVGTTGHRDLDPSDQGPLREAVHRVLSGLLSAHPSSPFVLLSALAEGADRLVARVALDLGMALCVPLPMREDAYRTTFSSATPAGEFDALLRRARWTVDVRSFPIAGAPRSASAGASAEQLYERLGEFLVHESDVLLALWNGIDSDLPGGTGSVVRSMVAPAPGANVPARGPVYHVVTPRARNRAVDGTPFGVVVRHAAATGPKRAEETLRAKDRLNAAISTAKRCASGRREEPEPAAGAAQRDLRRRCRAIEAAARCASDEQRRSMQRLALSLAAALSALPAFWLFPSILPAALLATAGGCSFLVFAWRRRNGSAGRIDPAECRALAAALAALLSRSENQAREPSAVWVERALRTARLLFVAGGGDAEG
jgi:hypothetical protein